MANKLRNDVPASYARVGFVSKDVYAASSTLEAVLSRLRTQNGKTSWSLPKQGAHFRSSGVVTSGKVAALFSGQGSQYTYMFDDVAMNWPPVSPCLNDHRLIGYLTFGIVPNSECLNPSFRCVRQSVKWMPYLPRRGLTAPRSCPTRCTHGSTTNLSQHPTTTKCCKIRCMLNLAQRLLPWVLTMSSPRRASHLSECNNLEPTPINTSHHPAVSHRKNACVQLHCRPFPRGDCCSLRKWNDRASRRLRARLPPCYSDVGNVEDFEGTWSAAHVIWTRCHEIPALPCCSPSLVYRLMAGGGYGSSGRA